MSGDYQAATIINVLKKFAPLVSADRILAKIKRQKSVSRPTMANSVSAAKMANETAISINSLALLVSQGRWK
jgi:hypothetical protein